MWRMPARKNPRLGAVQKIVSALEPLDSAEQDQVISSVLALLGKSPPRKESSDREDRDSEDRGRDDRENGSRSRETGSGRPKGLTELLAEKKPGTNEQRIALFAYYRDKYEHNSRFSRDDLENYFGTARLDPPGNYDRDFASAVERGWLHENGDQSYITTSGIEAVEVGFEGRKRLKRPAAARRRGTAKKSGKKRSTSAKRR
jgi:hypothetical protein